MRPIVRASLIVCGLLIASGTAMARPRSSQQAPVYTVTFVSHDYDEGRCETKVCWDVVSPTRQAISHFTIGIDGCDPVGATVRTLPSGAERTYSASRLDALYTAHDPRCGVAGIKFDDGFRDGEARRVCLTYAGMQPLATAATDFAIKAGTACIPTVKVDGPACGEPASCDEGECGEGVWACPDEGGPAVCELEGDSCGGCSETCGDGSWCGGGECDPDAGSCVVVDRCPDSSAPHCQEDSRSCSECPDGSAKNTCGGCGLLEGSVGDYCGDVCGVGRLACDGGALVCKDRVEFCCVGPDACTAGHCEPDVGCVFEPVVCADNNACTANSCDPIKGCVTTPVSCDDQNACTIDSCDPATGCVNTAIGCNDFDACTTDVCDPAVGCKHLALSCNDDNACTTDACDSKVGCVQTPVTCEGDACNVGYCDPTTGACALDPVVCDDDNACTDDRCHPRIGCEHVPLVCEDSSLCTTDSCNPEVGCESTPVVCNDDNACTVDSCHPRIGCEFKAKTCDDGAFCNGIETCNPDNGACQGSGDPCQGELTCDESADVCVECLVDADCRPFDECSTATCEFNVCDYDSSACEEECIDTIELGALTRFNLLACGDYMSLGRYGAGSSDVEGKLAVAGHLTMTGFGVAEHNPGPLALVVGGAWTLLDGTVYGSAHYGVAGAATRVDFREGVSQGLPIDFGFECAAGVKASRQTAALTVSGTTTVQPWGAIELRGTDPVRNVFEVPVDALNVCNSFAVITPVGAAVVINVVGGSSAQLSNFQTFFNEPNQQNNPLGTPMDVVWNFPEATQLVIEGFGVKGSLLAPFADVEFHNGHVDGSMIAGSVSGNGEFHHVLFRHDLTCPPIVQESGGRGVGVD